MEIYDNELKQENIADNEITKALEASKMQIPNGYIEINLSTKGRLYAPASFHIRNFTTEDLMGIALTDDENLPVKVVEMLDKLILEDNVSVREFHEEEVTETLFILYRTFYSDSIKEIEYIPTERDYKFLADQNGGEDSDDYKSLVRSLKNRSWNPKVDISLDSVEIYECPENIKTVATVKKANGFTCKYSMPRYGDVIQLRECLARVFSERDKSFESIERTIKFAEKEEQRWRNGENVNLRAIPRVPKVEKEKYDEYQLEKSVFLMRAIRALHLEEFNGQDVSSWSLDKKYELAKDPELDYPTFKKIADAFSNIKIGINDHVKVRSPICKEVLDYEYKFRLFTLLQAIQNNGADGTIIDFE